MIREENDCVGCEHCRFCGARNAKHFYCDKCGEDVEELYDYEGQELCEVCLLEEVPKVEVDAYEQ